MMMSNPHVAKVLAEDRMHKRRVARWVWEHRAELSGRPGDWHMLVNAYYDVDDYRSALLVAQAGLERFPSDATLMADTLWCAASLGDWETGDRQLALVEQEDHRAWEKWSLAVYVSDYLRAKAHAQDAAARGRTYQRALDFVRGAEKRIPATDRLINCEAEVLIDSGDLEGAREVLEDAIFMSDYAGESRNPKRRPVPQCCVTYLEDILAESCDYETIIRVCDAGVRFATVPTDSTKVGYFLFRKAEAMDAQMLADAAGRGAKGFSPERVREVLRTYSLAYKLHSSTTYRSICRDRFMILCDLAGIDDMDVDVCCPRDKDEDD